MADKDALDESQQRRPADSSEDSDTDSSEDGDKHGDAAAVVRQQYEAAKTGDPIGDAALRADLGLPTTPQEQEALDDQQFELAFSPNIAARERFEQSNPEGAPSPQHEEDYAKFLEDVDKALIDRDPKALVRARDALGLPTTPEDIAKFKNPSAEDVMSAARESQLKGVEIPDNSALDTQIKNVFLLIPPGAPAPTNTMGPNAAPAPAPEWEQDPAKFREDVTKATIDRDLPAFLKARDALGVPATPEEIAKFENPSAVDVLQIGRHWALVGVEIPDGSALDTQIDNVIAGVAPGAVAPTNTTGLRPPGAPTSGTNTSSGTGSTPGTGASPNAGANESPVDRSDFGPSSTNTGGDTPTPGAGSNPAASPGAGTAPGSPGAAPSAIDSALANLQGGSPSAPDIPTPAGGSAPSSAGLSMPGGVGTSSTGVGTGNTASGASGGTAPTDDSGFEVTSHPDGSSSTMDSDGNIYNNFPNGARSVTHPDGSAETYDSDGNQTSSSPAGTYNYEATKAAALGNDDSGNDDSGNDDSDDDDSGNDDSDDDDSDDDDSDDDDSGMVNPDAGGDDTGIGGGGGNVDLASSSTSTSGGAVDGINPDSSFGKDITGEITVRNQAGPDVNPDAGGDGTGIGGGEGNVDLGNSSTSTSGGAIDPVNPDLLNTIGTGPIEPPEDDGVNPYAAEQEADGTAAGPSGPLTDGPSGPPTDDDADGHTVDHTAAALGSGGLQPMDGSADLGGVADIADANLDIGVTSVPDDAVDQDAGGGPGGPLDDGFD